MVEAWRAHLANPPLRAAFGIGFCILFAFIGTFTFVNFVLVRAPFMLDPHAARLRLLRVPALDRHDAAGRRCCYPLRHAAGMWGSLLVAVAGLPLLLSSELTLVLTGMVLVGGRHVLCAGRRHRLSRQGHLARPGRRERHVSRIILLRRPGRHRRARPVVRQLRLACLRRRRRRSARRGRLAHAPAEGRTVKIGIRVTIAGLVLTAIAASTIGVHLSWWRTAERISRDLAATINQQIVLSVTQQLSAITTEAQAAYTTVRTLFLQNVLETTEADKREFVFLSQMQAQPTVSWVAFGWPNGAFFGAHKLGNTHLEMIEIGEMDGKIQRRTDRYAVVTGDIEFEARSFRGHGFPGARSGLVSPRDQGGRPAVV